MRPAGKSSLYRHEVRRAAIDAVLEAVDRLVLFGGAPVETERVASMALGPCLPLMTPGRPRHRLDVGLDRARASEDPRGRWVTRRSRHDRREPSFISSGPSRTGASWSAGRTAGAAKRRGLPSHGRRGGVDNAPQTPELRNRETLQAASRTCTRGHAGIELDVPEIGIAFDARRPRWTHLPRHRVRRARRRGLPTVRALQRRDEYLAVRRGCARRTRTLARSSRPR